MVFPYNFDLRRLIKSDYLKMNVGLCQVRKYAPNTYFNNATISSPQLIKGMKLILQRYDKLLIEFTHLWFVFKLLLKDT